MSAKHFVNDPDHAVIASLKSLTLTNPTIVFDEQNKIVYRHPASIEDVKNKVSVISGGGSGHEPGWAGYVGKGFLSASVAGTIFASPTAEQIRTCIANCIPDESKGILVLVMNYTGDVLNFGVGVEKAKAMGKDVELLVIEDDVGVGREKSGKVGRRGIGGVAFPYKICSALAEMEGSLKDVTQVGRLASENIVSIAASLSRTHVIGRPASDAADEMERLPYGSVELGMGIHNEPGCEKIEADLPETVKKMLSQLLDQDDKDRAFLKISESDEVAMLINNFGGLSNLELGACMMEVWQQLTTRYQIKPIRVYSGTILGSLNGLGFGVSLIKLVDSGLGKGKSLLDLLDAPCEVVGWPAPITPSSWSLSFPTIEAKAKDDKETQASNLQVDTQLYARALKAGLTRVIAAEPDVTRFDTIVGDGDCGIGLKRGAEAIGSQLSSSPPTSDLLINIGRLVRVVETVMDGTSGALYAIFLNSLMTHLRHLSPASPESVTPKIWATALRQAVESLETYTPAKVGDRTLVDALEPFVKKLFDTGDVEAAAEAAQKGSESTKGMKAALGRSVYVGGDGWKDIPDPGAYGLSELLSGLADGMK